MNIVLAAFSSYILALAKNLCKKTRTYNVDEIDYRSQGEGGSTRTPNWKSHNFLHIFNFVVVGCVYVSSQA